MTEIRRQFSDPQDTRIVLHYNYLVPRGTAITSVTHRGAHQAFTRVAATGGATVTAVDEAGVLIDAGTDVPRFDHDPDPDATRLYATRGLLMEREKFNFLRFSEAFDNALWQAAGATVATSTVTSPDAVTNAFKLEEESSATEVAHCVFQPMEHVSFGDNMPVTLSVWAKKAERQWLFLSILGKDGNIHGRAWFALDPSTAGVGTDDAVNNPATMRNWKNDWYRCSVTGDTVTGSGEVEGRIHIATADGDPAYAGGSVSDGIYVYGACLEPGPFVTSYIRSGAFSSPTLPTRPDDRRTAGIEHLGEGTMWVKVQLDQDVGVFAQLDNGTDDNRIVLERTENASKTIRARVIRGGAQEAIADLGMVADGTLVKAAVSWDATGISAVFNGQAVTQHEPAGFTLPSGLTTFRGGHHNTGAAPDFAEDQFQAYCLEDRVYRGRLPDKRIEELTR